MRGGGLACAARNLDYLVHCMAALPRSEPTRMASAGGQLRALNRLHAEALATLPLASMPVR